MHRLNIVLSGWVGQSVLSLDWQPLLDLSSPAVTAIASAHVAATKVSMHIAPRRTCERRRRRWCGKYHATLSPDEFVRLARITKSRSNNPGRFPASAYSPPF